MFQFRLPSLPDFSSWGATAINLPKVQVHDVEERPEKRARALKHLIKANHINNSVLYHNLTFHNHNPHILGSAYILGADSDELNTIYEQETASLERWQDSPGEIAKHDWRDNLGKPEYQRAYIDFFEDQLVKLGYDWHALVHEFLLKGPAPLINNLICGVGHPLIHLGYAYELSSRTIAAEALTLTACCYNDWHKYLDDPQYTRPAQKPSDSLFIIIDRVANDKAFDDLSGGAEDNLDALSKDETKMQAILEHWNSWDLTNPKDQFAESQKLAIALLVAAGGKGNTHDFFLCHLLTSSHAVRVILPELPGKWHIPLVRQWWFLTLMVYVSQLRPSINTDKIKLVELEGKDWSYVAQKAIKGQHRLDAHYVKALRSIEEAGKTWGDPNNFYLKAAVKYADEFNGWGGW